MIKSLKAIAVSSLVGIAAQGYAVSVSMDLTQGNRSVTSEAKKEGEDKATKSYESTYERSVAVHVQPVAEVPVSVGARVNFLSLDETGSMGLETASGWEVRPEIKVQAPNGVIPGPVAPYAKVGLALPFASSYKLRKTEEAKAIEGANKDLGFNVNLGANVKVNDNVGLLVEYSYNNNTEEWKTEGSEDKKEQTKTSHAVLAGLSLSI